MRCSPETRLVTIASTEDCASEIASLALPRSSVALPAASVGAAGSAVSFVSSETASTSFNRGEVAEDEIADSA